MELITFCGKVFQIRFFLWWHIVENVINHVIICLFQFLHLCQRLIFSLAILDLCQHNFIHFFNLFHQLFIISWNSFFGPTFLFQNLICCFFNRNFIVFIDATIHQSEFFIIERIVIPFLCDLNRKISLAYLICQFFH